MSLSLADSVSLCGVDALLPEQCVQKLGRVFCRCAVLVLQEPLETLGAFIRTGMAKGLGYRFFDLPTAVFEGGTILRDVFGRFHFGYEFFEFDNILPQAFRWGDGPELL